MDFQGQADAKNLSAGRVRLINEVARPLPKGFIELLGRSNFSFLQGASHPEEMVETAIKLGYDGLGLCDLNGLYGIVRGWETFKSPSHFVASIHAAKNFKYLVGTELTLVEGGSVTLMPMNKAGYTAVCEILTLGKRRAPKGFSKLSLDEIGERAHDCLVFLFPPWSAAVYEKAARIFGDRLYLPVWKDLTWESLDFYAQALQLEEHDGAQLFVTQRPFMHCRTRQPLFDVLTCILHKTTLDGAKTKLIQNGERFLHSREDLFHLWKERPDLVERTLEIAERVHFTLDEIRYRYPRGKLPEGMTASEYLRSLAMAGLHRRYPEGASEKVLAQADRELKLIQKLEYEDYFLTLFEICEFALKKGILYQGRGSAANSIVCFSLGITAVDPTRIKLVFERFISEERNEPPDIDVDFEHERREEVIQHIYEKYGEQHAAMVCNVIRYRSRMSFRETAKVFGIPLKSVNAAIKYMGRDGLTRLMNDREARARFDIPEDQWEILLYMANELKGFPRHLGIHSGGFVITQDAITECVPVEKATMDGRYVVQWNKDDVNALGLMKLDLLSLGMLSCLQKCFNLIRNVKGQALDLASIPEDDVPTYDMMEKADTIGVFQIESRAQMVTLPRMKPRCYYDLVVQVALIRPGPLQGGMVHPFLRRRAKLEIPFYAHPCLKPILERTLGVPLFQEQVMQITVEAAGFSAGEADELRRLMSAAWRRKGVMEGVRERVMTGLANKGISLEYAEQVYQSILGFSNYGFPESHAASFALLTYASSYIRCRHPEVFACALLNSQPMGFYDARTIVGDAQRHGVVVLDINVNSSKWNSDLEACEDQFAMRLGLRLIGGFKEEWAKEVMRARDGRAFTNLEEFIRRTNLPKIAFQKLASAGAFNDFEIAPRELLWKLESIELNPESLVFAKSRHSFNEDEDEYDLVPQENVWDGLWREYATKGLSTTHHPMSILRPTINDKNIYLKNSRRVQYIRSGQLASVPDKARVRVAGLINTTQRPPTAKGFCFITLEDEDGFFNIIVPPKVYERDRIAIYTQSMLEIEGHLERTGQVCNIKASRLLAYGAQSERLSNDTGI